MKENISEETLEINQEGASKHKSLASVVVVAFLEDLARKIEQGADIEDVKSTTALLRVAADLLSP